MKSKVVFNNNSLIVKQAKFPNGQTCLVLAEHSSPNVMYMKASIAIAGEYVGANQTIIKDFSENEGILNALIEAGIVEDTGVTIPTGFCEGHVVNILVELKEW